MRLAFVGTGYVGLVTAACLAEGGHEVTCVDLDAERVRAVNAGTAPILERGLPELIERNAGARLRATTDIGSAVRNAQVSMITVGTPFSGAGVDLTAVQAAARDIGGALRGASGYHVVCVKSTVLPGTTDGVVGRIVEETSRRRIGGDIGLAVNPEFLTEGQAVDDFMSPDRLIFGGIDERSLEVLEEIYADFSAVPRFRTTTRTAEMIKYTSNALLAAAISFANEIADLCSADGQIDAVEVMRGVHMSRYLSPLDRNGVPVAAGLASFLEAGCGFGGSCLPKDVSALVAHGERLGVDVPLLRSVLDVNGRRAGALLARLSRHIADLRGLRISVLGYAFKPDTDDARESPAISVIDRLLEAGARVLVHDPVATASAAARYGEKIETAASLEDAVAAADALVIVTRWREYDRLPDLLATLADLPLVVDGRRMLDQHSVPRYDGIGL